MKVFCTIAMLIAFSMGLPAQNDLETQKLPDEKVNQSVDLQNLNCSLLEAAIFMECNRLREARNLPPFRYSGDLKRAARRHSQNMARRDFFSHLDKKNRELRTPMDRIRKQNPDFTKTAENLARTSLHFLPDGKFYLDKNGKAVQKNGDPLKTKTYRQVAEKVVQNWLGSPSHRENLLGDFNFMACGVSSVLYDKRGIAEVLVTQNMGSK